MTIPAGVKFHVPNCRVAGRARRATLVRVSQISIEGARTLAAREVGVIRAGDAGPLGRRRETKLAPSIAHGLARFFDQYVPARVEQGRMSPRTVQDYRQQARRYLLPALDRRKIRDVTATQRASNRSRTG